MKTTAIQNNNKRGRRNNDDGIKTQRSSSNKKSRKDAAKHHTWRKQQQEREFDKDDNDDPHNHETKTTIPHAGSFANAAMRKKFDVIIPELDETDVQMKDNLVKENETDALKTSNDEENDESNTTKKKIALFVGFLGTKYGGFQVNENQRTLQAEMELALFRCGMISQSNFGFPYKYGWSNSARTDKGVHAAAQVCSCKVKLPTDVWESPNNNGLEEARKQLNSKLPSEIRILDIDRVTRKFCAKTQRDRVRYQYMVPAFMLHPDWRNLLETHDIDMTVTKATTGDMKRPIHDDNVKKLQAALTGYRSSDTSRKALKDALRKYEGTNYYHNYTRGLSPGQAQAQRYIQLFVAQDPVVVDDVEWIPTQVVGQSFLLNQIRKMIGVAIDVARGAAPLSFIEKALSKNESLVIDVAPAQGLFLEMSYYDGYNKRKNQQKNDLNDLDWTKEGLANQRWSEFREVVRHHIVQEEAEQGNFLQYMYRHEVIFDYRKEYKLDNSGADKLPSVEDVDS